MATRARRITIEIGGEDTGASKQFKSTEQDADKLAAKLKAAGDKAGRGLRDGVESETDKLGAKLRSAGKAAGDKFQGGLSSAMSGLSDAVSGGFDVGSIADSIGGELEGLGGMLGPAGAAAGVAVAGAFAVGFTDHLDLEAANDKLAAQLGLTAGVADEYGSLATEIYRGAWGDSIDEVNAALGAVHSSLADGLGPGEDALKRATIQALDLATAFDVDVVEAAGLAGVAVRQGLATDADHAFDLIVASMQRMPASMRAELFPAIEEYGNELANMGFTGEEAFGLLAAASQDGAFGIDKTGDAIKELAIRATDMSTASVDAFQAAGLDAQDMAGRFLEGGAVARGALNDLIAGLLSIEDPVERSNAAIALFGTPIEDLSVTEIPDFLASLTGMGTGLGDVGTAAEDMGEILNGNAATRIEEFKRQALGKLTDFVGNTVIPKLEAFSNWARDNPGAFQAMAIVLGIMTLAFIALGIAAGIATIGLIGVTLPIFLIVLAVLVLIAIIVLLILYWDEVKEAAGKAWDWIKEKAGQAWDWIMNKFTQAKNWIGNRIDDIVGFFTGLPGRLASAAGDLWGWLADSFKSAINAVIGLWNNFEIPSITIGGWSTPGPLPDVPSFTTPTIRTPNIPYLAEGGIVPARPGGMLAVIGEGRRDEAVIPLDDDPRTASGSGDIHVDVDVEMQVASGGDRLVADLVMGLVRRGVLTLSVNGQRVTAGR